MPENTDKLATYVDEWFFNWSRARNTIHVHAKIGGRARSIYDRGALNEAIVTARKRFGGAAENAEVILSSELS